MIPSSPWSNLGFSARIQLPHLRSQLYADLSMTHSLHTSDSGDLAMCHQYRDADRNEIVDGQRVFAVQLFVPSSCYCKEDPLIRLLALRSSGSFVIRHLFAGSNSLNSSMP
jgi:hypothetical protein